MRFQLLGPVVAHSDHGPVPLGSTRQRTVLAVLLTDLGSSISADQLVDRVWGAASPRRARETLHTYLSRLRAVLSGDGGPALVRRGHTYLVEADPTTVDLHRFRALSEDARRAGDDDRAATLWDGALGLWRGTPFADLDSEWLRAKAVALEAERLAAMIDRTDVLLRRGEHARLVEELGSEPGPALRELHQRVLRQDPELAVTAPIVAGDERQRLVNDRAEDRAAAAGGATVDVEVPAQLPADIPGFTGRDAALSQLDALLGPAGDPPPTVVISAIGGSGGIGKTALAVHWAHRVRDRFPDGQLYLNLRGFGAARGPNQQRGDPGE